MSNSHAMESNFTFHLSKISNVIYNLQSVELPSITLTERVISAAQWVDFQQAGDRLIYDKLNITFIVDENLENYLEIFNWIHEFVAPDKGTLGTITNSDLLSDAVLDVLGKQKQSVKKFRFHDAYPSILGPLMYSNSGTENRVISCQLSLSYSHFTYED